MYIKNINSLYVFRIFIVDSHMLTYTNADREGTGIQFLIHIFIYSIEEIINVN